uniref:NADH-ubiquinone oxidoreductase chain 5 n=1 Tax=Blaps rhynchoptera TaxID=1379410 RepID=A0A6H1XHU1_BLARH|nr:NADH dehydrogenase subunit 5 [Blaps rhynchoptera]QJA14893.1 NADH dehydrogenase subunit 5 [Blaps rhynchoptera]QJA15163.1 NADH dehydrogenase subunit 5 [Blaps rhynchoptera]
MLNICLIYSYFMLLLSLIFFFVSGFLMVMDLTYFLEFNLIMINSSCVLMTFLFDWMSLLFMSFVLLISSMVIYYSREYMLGDLNLNRFIMLVVMFVFSMMLLIISPNLISILLGWDGLGLVSYCLVIYYQNSKSYNAGMLTALSNRIGDVALLMAIAWMLNYGSWNYVFYLYEAKGDFYMNVISYLVVLAAMTKSAQIPFSSWLPAAMAAPTPVSSLVHSSTLVTAGVYLIIRFNLVFDDNLMYMLLFIGSMTMFMSGLGASFEFDLKKIIALSTLSQLGFMLSILALGSYKLAFFHLLTHALFKALLFMCAGNIIHNFNNCQDIRFMGGLSKLMPLTCVYLNISNLSLCGLPFLSGFYSKDLIVEMMSMGYLNFFIYFIFYFSIGLTVCYSFRLVYYTCVGNYNYVSLSSISESSTIMLKGMTGLIFFVVFMGSVLSWMIFPYPYVIILPFSLKVMTLFMILFGSWVGYELSKFSLSFSSISLNFYHISWFLAGMWNMPVISTLGVNYYPVMMGSLLYKSLDQGWTEYFGAQKIFNLLKNSSSVSQMFMFNSIKMFFILTVIWLLIILFI